MEQKTTEELLERRTQIASEIETDGADLDALEAEVRAINDELETRKQAEAQRRELRKAVADGDGETIKNFKEEREKNMTYEEIRSSKEYLDAYVKGIKTDNFAECRALMYEKREDPAPVSPLLTVNVDGGSVPVPTYVEDRIKAAWANNEVARRIRRTYYRGNLQVGFEAGATGAEWHEEGGEAVPDEELLIGIVTLIPQMIKKTIRLSDEVLDMRGEAFLDYIVDEFENKIVAAISNGAIDAILMSPASSNSTTIGVPTISKAADIDTVVSALALLTNDAARPVVVCSRGTYATIRAAALNAGYAVDPFEGCEVVFTNFLVDYSTALTNGKYMIVGDLSAVQANFPNGDDIKFVIDPYTEAASDLVRITGRVYAAIGVTTPGMLAVVKKP